MTDRRQDHVAEPGHESPGLDPTSAAPLTGLAAGLSWFGHVARARPRTLLAVVVGLTLLAGAIAAGVTEELQPPSFLVEGSESDAVAEQAVSAGLDREAQFHVLVRIDRPIAATATQDRVRALVRRIERHPGVAQAVSYYESENRALIAGDRRSALILGQLSPGSLHEQQDTVSRLEDSLESSSGLSLGGPAVATGQFEQVVRDDIGKAELIALPLVFLLALWFFRGAVAALMPGLVAIVATIWAFALLRLTNEVVPVSLFALNLTVALVLGLASDSSLLVVSRFREELASGAGGPSAVVTTLRTAGRTVIFSSLTVAAALASLLVFEPQYLYSMGLAGVLAALSACLAALLVLPPLLVLLGERINGGAPAWLRRRAEGEARPRSAGFWYRVARFVVRRAAPVAVLTSLLLLVLAAPALRLKTGVGGADSIPAGESARTVDDTLRAEYPRDPASAITVAYPKVDAAHERHLETVLASQPGVDAVAGPTRLGESQSVFQVFDGPAYSDHGQALVDRIRQLQVKEQLAVGGPDAVLADYRASIDSRLPLALVLGLAGSGILLFLVTGSIALPIKALLLNLLTVAAALGLLVVLVQNGALAEPLGFTARDFVDVNLPVFLAAVAFGLSTDYGVFLLSRIKEEHDRGLDDPEAIAYGLERVGRVFTAAALLFCVAFGAIGSSRVLVVKEIALGTVLAVLIDATIVRTFLVPSLMQLLGRWNWWAPARLKALRTRAGLD